MPKKPKQDVAKPKNVIVVHLGDVDHGGGTKTRRYAKRFPNFGFIGIDLQGQNLRRQNFQGIRGDFEEGLKKINDNSVDLISSETAVGFYFKGGAYSNISAFETEKIEELRQYTERIAELAFRKLKSGGKLHLTLTRHLFHLYIKDIRRIFKRKINTREFTDKDYERTPWAKDFRDRSSRRKSADDLIQIEAVK